MKLLRYGPKGDEKPGTLDAEGRIRDLSGVVADITPEQLYGPALAALKAIDPTSLPLVEGQPRYGVPVKGSRKFIAIGLNFADHAAEAGQPIPKEPIVFMKATTCIQGPNDPVMLPKGSVKSDWEVELGVVIGTRARYVSQKDALNFVAGYCTINDVSEREYQIERGGTWDKGKGCDTFAPLGPFLATPDELADPGQLRLWLKVNGELRQDGTTANLIFTVPYLIAYVSQFMTLLPGDVLSTGTPAGVGLGQKPPVYLRPGDVVELGIDGLGSARQRVRAFAEQLL